MLELSLYSLLSHPGFTFDINNTTTYINPESMKVAVRDRYCSRIHSFQAWIFSDEAVKNSFLRYKPFERYTSEISTVHGKTWHCIRIQPPTTQDGYLGTCITRGGGFSIFEVHEYSLAYFVPYDYYIPHIPKYVLAYRSRDRFQPPLGG